MSKGKLATELKEARECIHTLEEELRITNEGVVALNLELEKEIDIRKQKEEELRKSNKLLVDIIEFLPEATFVIDLDRKVIAWNRGIAEMTGIRKETIIGKDYYAYVVPVDGIERPMLVDLIFSIDEGIRSHYNHVNKEGDTLFADSYLSSMPGGQGGYYWATASPLLDNEGNIIGAIESIRDVTEWKKAEEKLEKLAQDLKHSNEELEQFVYVSSHDLQEPLRMVASYVQLLKRRYKGKLDADADDFIDYAVEGATRMQNLINDLLTFCQVGAHGNHFEQVNCEAVLEQALINLEISIEESGAIITRDPLPEVMADPSQLTQLLQNLISNGLKFHGDQSPEIHVSAQRQGDEWLFSVRDNGIGIETQYFDRIFGIFQRLHGKTKYSGTGIGLAICNRIVVRHGGRIWVESEHGEGSTFYFTIPAMKEVY
jgi:chemotaxis family two-component system sensor kinase Cph1